MKFVTVCFGFALVTLVGCQSDSSGPAAGGAATATATSDIFKITVTGMS